jgi:hypothetical protein
MLSVRLAGANYADPEPMPKGKRDPNCLANVDRWVKGWQCIKCVETDAEFAKSDEVNKDADYENLSHSPASKGTANRPPSAKPGILSGNTISRFLLNKTEIIKMICPCCGTMVPLLPVKDLNRQALSHIERRLVSIMAQRHLDTVNMETNVDTVCANERNGGPLFAKKCILTTMHRLRKKLRPTGWTVKATTGGIGVVGECRLEPVEAQVTA